MTLTPEIVDTPSEALSRDVRNDYVPCVATPKRKTPQRTIVVDPTVWDNFGDNAKLAGSERAVVLRAFMLWYNRVPGARLPQRPGD